MLDEDRTSRFKTWLDDHGGIVLKIARAYTRTGDDGRDLAQEILLQMWRSMPRFGGHASAATWIYRVALNTALNWRRGEQRRRLRQRPLVDLEDQSSDGADGARHAMERETVDRLYAAIRQLPQADAALVLMDLDDLSDRQIAEVLGISESNVAVKLNRARKALCALMKDDSHDP